MPTYEYVCEACTHEFEAFQSITAPPLKKCPRCNKRKLRRKIGTGAVVLFKGSGFYETDYRSSHYKQAAQAEAAPSSKACESCACASKTDSACRRATKSGDKS